MIKKMSDPSLDEKYIEGSGKLCFDGSLLKVRLDQVQLPGGRQAAREWIHHSGAVAIVPVLPDGRIVLVKQCRYPMGTVMWEIPAGKLDHGPKEEPEACARRELSEETGYEAASWQYLLTIATTPGFSDEVIHLYKAWDLVQTGQHCDEDEFITVAAFTVEELAAMAREGSLFDGKTLAALYAAGIMAQEKSRT